MKPKLERLRAKIEQARLALEEAVAAEQAVCKHEHLAECDYKPLYEGALPPMRMCLSCGMTEDGWGCGYVVLNGKASPIGRDALYAKRSGLAIQDCHKGRLIRREVTVAELVATEGGAS
mgnify:CR=1 FL=1